MKKMTSPLTRLAGLSLTALLLFGGATVLAQSPTPPAEGGKPGHCQGKKKKMLEQFDANKDGQLDDSERAAAKQAHEAKLLEKYDTNGDGQLDEAERSAMPERPKGKGRHAKHHKKMLEKFDANKDGQLDEQEKAKAKAFREERKKEALAKFDADGDGQLNQEERRKAREAWKAEKSGNASTPAS